jgi:hypothetical protein
VYCYSDYCYSTFGSVVTTTTSKSDKKPACGSSTVTEVAPAPAATVLPAAALLPSASAAPVVSVVTSVCPEESAIPASVSTDASTSVVPESGSE